MDSPKTTNILLIVVLVVILVLGLLYFFLPHKSSAPEGSTSTSPVATSSAFSYTTKTIKDEDAANTYSIEASYPIFSLSNVATEKKINDDISTLVNGEISSFRSSFSEPSSFTVNEGPSTFKLSFDILKNSHLSNIVPVKISENFYSAGAAHPGGNVITRNYDLGSGQDLSLASLFQPGSQYLKAISSYAIKTLNSKLGEGEASQIEQGASPANTNFQNFLVTDSGLIIIFNEYQVAAYAAGEQEITIPWAVLQNILNPDLNLI